MRDWLERRRGLRTARLIRAAEPARGQGAGHKAPGPGVALGAPVGVAAGIGAVAVRGGPGKARRQVQDIVLGQADEPGQFPGDAAGQGEIGVPGVLAQGLGRCRPHLRRDRPFGRGEHDQHRLARGAQSGRRGQQQLVPGHVVFIGKQGVLEKRLHGRAALRGHLVRGQGQKRAVALVRPVGQHAQGVEVGQKEQASQFLVALQLEKHLRLDEIHEAERILVRHEGVRAVRHAQAAEVREFPVEHGRVVRRLAHVVEIVAEVDVENHGVVFQGLAPEVEALQVVGEGDGGKAQVDHAHAPVEPHGVELFFDGGAQAVLRLGHGKGEGIADGQDAELVPGLFLGHDVVVVVKKHRLQGVVRGVHPGVGKDVFLFVAAKKEIHDEAHGHDLDEDEQRDAEDATNTAFHGRL
ncbi:hypothetical protein DSECCO2_622920 [anaerobic digester metagenome]